MRRFYDESAVAGTSAAPQSDSETPTSGTEGAAPAAGGEPAADAGGGKELSPEEKYTALMTKHTELEASNKDLKTKYDRSQTDVGTLRKTFRDMASNPDGFRKVFDEKFPTLAPGPDMDYKQLLGESASPQQVETLKGMFAKQKSEITSEILGHVSGPLNDAQEMTHASRYEDWDDLAEFREVNSVQIRLNQIPAPVVAHLVTQAQRIPEMLNDYKKLVEAEVMSTLEKKYAGYVPAGGQGSGAPAPTKAKGGLKIENVLDQLK